MILLSALAEVMVDPQPAPAPTVIAAGVVGGEREPQPSRGQASRAIARAGLLTGHWGAFQRCVAHRESKGSPTVVNSSGHAGVYQFSIRWRHGLPFVVQRGLVHAGMSNRQARAIRLSLPSRIEQWPARFQHVGFAQVIREGGRDAALRHWGLAGSSCNGLAVGS